MGKFYDITGVRYGRLTVVRMTDQKKYDKHVWECLCDCGKTTYLIKRALQSGNSQSCGCLTGDTARTHGKTNTPLYRTWTSVRTRCLNQKAPQYKHYGARGITICDRWQGENGFANFEADMGTKPSPRHSLDRIDNNGPYSPENCRWATPGQQSNNQRTNIQVSLAGKTQTLMQWVRELNLPYDRVWWRLKSGWPPAKALELTQ